MPSFPDLRAGVGPVISKFSWTSVGPSGGLAIGGTSSPWPTANMAQIIPFRLMRPFTIQHLFLYNGSTVSGNFDIGVYNAEQKLILSTGSTAQAGVSAIQRATVAATTLPAGDYYLALVVDNTTATVMVTTSGSSSNSNAMDAAGVRQMASAFPLPASATFDTLVNMTFIRIFGLSSRTF